MYFDWKCSALRQWLTIDYKKIPDDVAFRKLGSTVHGSKE